MPETLPDRYYGGGRALPAHATIEDPQAGLGSGLLCRVLATLTVLHDGQVLRIASSGGSVRTELRGFAEASGHALLSDRPDPARPGWRVYHLRKGRARTNWSAVGDAVAARPGLATTGLPGPADDATRIADLGVGAGTDALESLMPRRLWLYLNYDCNLACDYCCVVSSPEADPRRLPAERARSLIDDAAELGFEQLFVTGGEPLIRRDLADLLGYAIGRLPVTLLTNAMLVRGPRWDRLRPLVGPRLAFQVSLDSADPVLHDAHRGAGAHARALEGIRVLREAGARILLAATLGENGVDEIPRLHALADELGIDPMDRIFRPIALRGAAAEGEPLCAEDLAPDLTADVNGWFWHPVSTDPDFRLPIPADADLATAVAAVRCRLLELLSTPRATPATFTCG